jgi:DNA repair exonuclease SbcCD ATPase subunit
VAPAALPVSAPGHSDLVSRLERVEEELETRAAAGDRDSTELRGAVEDVSERISAVEPVLEELGKALESLATAEEDARIAEHATMLEELGKALESLATAEEDARIAEHATMLEELSLRLEQVVQSVDAASRRTNEIADDAAEAVESFRDGLAAVTERLAGLAAADDLAALRELVDALVQRPSRDEELIAQVDDLRTAVDALAERPARDTELVAQVNDLRVAVTTLAERPTRSPELVAQIDTLAARLVEVGDRVDVLAAAAQATPGDPEALEELRDALAELARRPTADPEAERRLEIVATAVDELRATVDALAAKPAGDPELDDKLWQLTSRLEDLERAEALDEIRARLSELAERPTVDPALLERVEELERTDAVEELRSRLTELAEKPSVDPALAQRLGELERRLDEVPGDDVLERIDADGRSLGFRIDGVIARLDELAVSVEQKDDSAVSRDAWDEAVAVLNSRLEAETELTARLARLEERLPQAGDGSPEGTADPELAGQLTAQLQALQERVAQVEANGGAPSAAGPPDAAIGKQLAALSARVDQIAAEVGSAPRADGESAGASPATPPTLERDVEHVLMAIERLSVHLGAHERALTELMGSGGLVAQVRELSARVGDIETFGTGVAGDGSGGGGGEMRSELRTLMRRLEEAEEAQRNDRERLIDQLEKAAGAIDWRLQRLETSKSDQPDA